MITSAVTFYQHVESKVAAMMRRDGTAKADLVLDNTVCGSNQRDQDHEWSCDKILPSIIPPGSELTVYATRDQGKTWWKRTYVGTGERIIR
ncbi:DddA-like double-stranded DNA deaminase toxin [Micromonospora sp. LOL_023]|uniref:DddA-like double-stranded DNA deaminase toxin n=1 Tax=Micromonospora sp. LOL_023 TaxID=3345418 RepID=UPI003A8891E1